MTNVEPLRLIDALATEAQQAISDDHSAQAMVLLRLLRSLVQTVAMDDSLDGWLAEVGATAEDQPLIADVLAAIGDLALDEVRFGQPGRSTGGGS